jgi:hypothetical protein
MSEWWTYRLSDFLMFSPATYWRMVERYNREVWPLQVVMVAAGVCLLWWVGARRPKAQQVVAGVLAAAWAWVGWAFHAERYAQINWAATYLAVAFAVQAALLIVAGLSAKATITRPERSRLRGVGLALAAIGILVYPFISLSAGRPLAQAELFGLMPEPTALATIGLLLASRPVPGAWLMAIPVLSLLVGVATLWM